MPVIWILVCILAAEVRGGALITQEYKDLQDNFWDKITDFVQGALHLVGSFLPLRGMATIGKDLGIPYADTVLTVLTPSSSTAAILPTRTSQRRSDTFKNQEEEVYISMRDEMSSAVGALLGKGHCQKRLACLSGRHLSHINGAASIALLMSTATNFLPDDFREPLSIVKDSIMYSDDCEQFVC